MKKVLITIAILAVVVGGVMLYFGDVQAAEEVVDSYPESNYNGSVADWLSSGWDRYLGQSFTGDGKNITSIKVYLKKKSSPTGNLVAYIYAHSGTFGSSSVPTGSPLATSENLDVSTLSTTIALKTINFSGSNKIELISGTKYVLVIYYAGGDASNYVIAGMGKSPSTHSGNASFSSDGITYDASGGNYDNIFYVYGESAGPTQSTAVSSKSQPIIFE